MYIEILAIRPLDFIGKIAEFRSFKQTQHKCQVALYIKSYFGINLKLHQKLKTIINLIMAYKYNIL